MNVLSVGWPFSSSSPEELVQIENNRRTDEDRTKLDHVVSGPLLLEDVSEDHYRHGIHVNFQVGKRSNKKADLQDSDYMR